MVLDINWNAVYAFWLVAERGSFAEAARALPRGSVQALNKRVRKLERPEELNLKLLRSRGVKGVELTEAGRHLYDLVTPVFKSFGQIVAEARGEDAGVLILAMVPYASYNYAPELLSRFCRKFPNVSVILLSGNRDEVIGLIENGRADFGFAAQPSGGHNLVVGVGVPMRYEILAPMRFRRWRTPTTWHEVLEYPMVLIERNSRTRQILEAFLLRQNLLRRLQIAAEVPTAELAADAVRAGLGLSVVPVGPRLAKSLRGLVRTAPPPGLQRVDMAAFYRKDRYQPRYMRTFLEMTRDVMCR